MAKRDSSIGSPQQDLLNSEGNVQSQFPKEVNRKLSQPGHTVRVGANQLCPHHVERALIRFPPAVRTVGRIAVVSRFRRGGDGFGFLLRNARARGGDVENGGGVDEDGVAAGERSPGSAAGKAEVEQGAEEAEDVLSAGGREHSVGVTT